MWLSLSLLTSEVGNWNATIKGMARGAYKGTPLPCLREDWAMNAFQDLLFYGGGFADILPEMAVLLAAATVLFGVGVWRFRYV